NASSCEVTKLVVGDGVIFIWDRRGSARRVEQVRRQTGGVTSIPDGVVRNRIVNVSRRGAGAEQDYAARRSSDRPFDLCVLDCVVRRVVDKPYRCTRGTCVAKREATAIIT